jgi:UDP-GlcNAc:undecaprenyl-phosphate GlcNAc-1-phosphate transferase
MGSSRDVFLAVGMALGLSLSLTPLVRALARRAGAVARPRSDRWHRRPTALLGGIAIAVSVLATALAFVPNTTQSRVVLGSSALLFLVGLVDDFRNLKPYQKLVGQVLGATLVVASGLTLPWTTSVPLNTAVTIFWLVGITNAVNLLDNMDGLAAGVALIASAFLSFHFWSSGQAGDAVLLAVLGAALLGYLVYNSYPASIFMGDSGSLFIGFFLASAALLQPAAGRSRSFLPVLAVPVLTLFIPIFDTTFVMVLRKLAGRPASQGGRDHTSHRLVALGLSERSAVWMLYGLATLSGLIAVLVRHQALDVSLAAIVGFVVALSLLGVHLGGVKVYDEADGCAGRDTPLVSWIVDLSYKRRVFEVLLDVALIVLSYYTASALVYGPIASEEARGAFVSVVPVLVFVNMATFLSAGVYRGIWRYVGIDDLFVYAQATIAGSAISVPVLLVAGHTDLVSRTVFVVDTLILLVLLSASRMTLRLLRRLLPAAVPSAERRVLIYGAGDAGELLARELVNNRSLSYCLVGFVDDDPLKKGKVINGFRVFGGNGSFLSICKAQRVDEVLISTARIPDVRVRQISLDCATARVAVKRMRIHLEPVAEKAPVGLNVPMTNPRPEFGGSGA